MYAVLTQVAIACWFCNSNPGVAINDGARGSELHKLNAEGMFEDRSVFGYCDFAVVAPRFGLQGNTFSKLDDAASPSTNFG